jgi:hypothetical protein
VNKLAHTKTEADRLNSEFETSLCCTCRPLVGGISKVLSRIGFGDTVSHPLGADAQNGPAGSSRTRSDRKRDSRDVPHLVVLVLLVDHAVLSTWVVLAVTHGDRGPRRGRCRRGRTCRPLVGGISKAPSRMAIGCRP